MSYSKQPNGPAAAEESFDVQKTRGLRLSSIAPVNNSFMSVMETSKSEAQSRAAERGKSNVPNSSEHLVINLNRDQS